MPARSVESSPGNKVIIATCEVCGEPAPFGMGVNLRLSLQTKKPEHAGKHYCAEHYPRSEA